MKETLDGRSIGYPNMTETDLDRDTYSKQTNGTRAPVQSMLFTGDGDGATSVFQPRTTMMASPTDIGPHTQATFQPPSFNLLPGKSQ